MSSLIDVYPYRIINNQLEFLLLHRAKGMLYEGQWRMIGGKVKINETHTHAAEREFKEETGLMATLKWVVPTVNAFYDPNTDQIRYIPAFAYECKPGPVTLNHEHDDYLWCDLQEAQEKLAWYEQKRIIGIIAEIVKDSKILKEWIL
jgi:dihydroneopterin triphosphate diphosphatase